MNERDIDMVIAEGFAKARGWETEAAREYVAIIKRLLPETYLTFRACLFAGMREAATLVDDLSEQYAKLAESDVVTDAGRDLHDTMSKATANAATTIRDAIGHANGDG
jgi:hypothetical protein